MRRMLIALFLTAALVPAGCGPIRNNYVNNRDNGSHQPIERPTVASLVQSLNENAQRIPALESRDVSIDCKQGSQGAPGMTGVLVCQKPRSFRLQAKVIGQNAVDIGSNDQEFWYWISKADPPYVYHCTYDALAKGNVRMPFPFQPDMIVAGLGLSEYDPTKQYDLKETSRDIWELSENTVSPQGQPVKRVTVFNARRLGGTMRWQAVRHELRDAQNREICTAHITEFQQSSETGAILPRRVKLVWPSEKIEMALKLDSVRVAPVAQERAQNLFSRQTLADIQSFDLALWRVDARPSSLQRVGGTTYQR
jgi:hypothetical protein